MSGGLITSTANGNGNNNLIEICSNIVWSSSCGDLVGPLSLPAYDCVLPITLVSFTAEKSKSNVLLKWTTASEINNDYFMPERSKDGKAFEEVGRVQGAGNSTTMLSYSLTDASPFDGVSYYRLKQVDFDGTSSYSDIVAVNMENKDFEALNITPDIMNGIISITLRSNYNGKAEYSLSDVLGNNIHQGTVESSKGLNQIDIRAYHLAQGVYYFTIRNDHEILTKKIFY